MKTGTEDLEAIVGYLSTKATGATNAEARAAIDSKLLDGRKLTAYERWGFVTREGDKMRLSPTGWELSRASSERKASLYADVIRNITPYTLAAEWTFHQRFDRVTNVALAAHWHQHCRQEVGSNETSIREQVNCFFNLAQSAQLGTYIIGRKGQPTRFEVGVDNLSQFIAETGFRGSVDGSGADVTTPSPVEAPSPAVTDGPPLMAQPTQPSEGAPRSDGVSAAFRSEPARVFISHSKNMDIVDQIKTMLELANMDHEVAVEEETTAIPVPEKVLAAMHRCTAAVICVTADERSRRGDDTFTINENVLIEIGAAFVLYDKKVVLVWDRRLEVPSNLQGLYRCEFEGSELSWSAGMKLMKAVNNFKKADASVSA